MGCQVSEGGMQNKIDFWPNIDTPQENYDILCINIVSSHLKLGIISKKLRLVKHLDSKKCAPKMILIRKKITK